VKKIVGLIIVVCMLSVGCGQSKRINGETFKTVVIGGGNGVLE